MEVYNKLPMLQSDGNQPRGTHTSGTGHHLSILFLQVLILGPWLLSCLSFYLRSLKAIACLGVLVLAIVAKYLIEAARGLGATSFPS